MTTPRCPRPFVAGFGVLVAVVAFCSTAIAQQQPRYQAPSQENSIFSGARPGLRTQTHESITIDGDLTDLIGAVGRNPGAGCALTSPVGNIYTQVCQFVNGYDITNGYVFVDFLEPGGGVSQDFILYAGWQVTGQIGDYDGDGNPSVFSNSQGGCAIVANEAGTNRDGRTGISANESYTVEFRDCTTGDLFRLGVKDNQVINFDTNQPLVGATYARNGSFLELRLPNVKQALSTGTDLCDMLISLTSNAEFDGLGEDRTTACNVEVPISVDIQKTPDTQAVCQGDPATFTITVTNDGHCHLDQVRVSDVLGAGLTFQSANPAPTTQNGQELTWEFPEADLEPGETIVITLVATASGPCTEVPFRNDVSVEAVHDVNEAACPGRADRSATDSDFAEVTCRPEPCVDQVTCDAPASACDGDQITVSASARNCSTGPESITIEILGPGGAVLDTETFPNVGAGQTVTASHTFTFDCSGEAVTYSSRATASNDCGTTPPVSSDGCPVQCNPEPCVDQVACQAPASACDGDQITVSASARNCSTGPEDITIEILGPGGAVLDTETFPNVGAGQTVTASHTFTFDCSGSPVTYSARASASNSCGSVGPVASSGCAVECSPEPCVDQVACQAPASACDGDQITVSASARNCSTGPEDITIEILGPGGAVLDTETFPNVGAGQTVTASHTFAFDCSGEAVTYSARASASNSCGEVGPVASSGCAVQCNPGPCVDQVACQAPASACDGDQITVSASARNCSTGSESITLEILGPGGAVLHSETFPNVGAGETVNTSFSFTFDCNGEAVTYSARARASNNCGETADVTSSGCAVECNPEPCVDQVACQAPASACDGDQITISASARNCSSGPENINLQILGPGGAVLKAETFNDVPAGQTVSTSVQVEFDCSGEAVTYSARADASNNCGEVGPVTSSGCAVQCSPEPCVDQVACQAPESACDGDQITVSASARNCSSAPESITLEILGPGGAVLKSETFPNVAAGGTVNTSVQVEFDCSGEAVTYSARASASNSCGSVGPVSSSGCAVQCSPEPCVEVVCDAPATASGGEPFTVSGTATNCSTGPEDIEICIYGPGGALLGCQTFEDVPAGQSRTHSVQFTCEEGGTLTFSVTANASNSCGSTGPVRSANACETQCQVGENCPRTVGFWGQQAEQKPNGSTKFSREEVAQIADCIDDRMDAFNWSDDFAGFAEVINPSKPLDCKKQALRQVAGLLANLCVGQLGILASNGDSIYINPSTPNPCPDAFPDADTIGELIDAIDDRLVELLNSGADAKDFCAISECADGINNGRGIPLDERCSEGTDPVRSGSSSDLDNQAGGEGQSVDSALELYRPTPNPFSQSTTIAYAVGGQTGESVQIGIYDVAGRLVKELVNGFQAPGRYQAVWNGRSNDGVTVTKGVYFLRAHVGGVRVESSARILYVR